jgi:hypothetical protein
MPVDTPHPEYAYRKPDWAKIRTFIEGTRAVKAAGETYLPKITGQTPEEYSAFKARAEVYGALSRTVDGLTGAVFLKSPTIELPAGSEEFQLDVTLAGNTITEWLRTLVGEAVSVARGGVLIDYSGSAVASADPAGASERPGVMAGADRPYLVSYSAEQITNWETAILNGKTMLTMVVLEESGWTPASNDLFAKVITKSYRVLRLVDGVYHVERHTPKVQSTVVAPDGNANTMGTGASAEYEKTSDFVPTRRGEPLKEIPFFFVGAKGQSISPEKPPLLDVAELSHLHYMCSADYAHGLHWVGLPTPWVTGVSDKDKLAIGPTTAIVIADNQAKVGMLEFTGQGLDAVEKRLSGLERKMAILGARILEEQKKDAESAETVKLRQGGDASVLAGISDAVSRAAESILARMLWWAGTSTEEPDVTVELNMDFMLARLGHQDLLALLQAWQAGSISKETFLYNLKRGQILSEETTVEDEMAKLETETPPGMETTKPASGGKGGQAQ